MEEHNSIITPTIEKGSLVLVTGVTSFIGGHIANQFLIDGYNVRGTVRSLDKIRWLQEMSDANYGKGRFEAVEVPDMTADGAFDEAVKGVSGICHVASVTTFSDKPDEVVPPTVKGTLNIMTAATKESSVKSVVYTSSSAAAVTPKPNEVFNITKETWNQEAVDEANGPNPTSWGVYSASKTEAELAVWKVVRETNPPFQVSAVLPNANFGPILQPGGEMESSTATMVVKLFNGDRTIFDIPPQYFVNVKDDAKLHVIATVDPACKGDRIFAFAAPFTWNEILGIFRKIHTGRSFMEDQDDNSADLSKVLNEDAEALLRKHYGHGFMALEETIRANTQGL